MEHARADDLELPLEILGDAGQGRHGWSFRRVGWFANYTNATNGETTVPEIVAATTDGKTLVYTDAGPGTVGFIDITNPANPQPGGTLALDPNPTDDVVYSPTSVEVLRNQYVLVTSSPTIRSPSSRHQAEEPGGGHPPGEQPHRRSGPPIVRSSLFTDLMPATYNR